MGCARFADLGFPGLSKLVCSENIRFWVVPILQIEGFPSILFFPAGEKSKKPLAVDTERTATAFLEYIKKNAGIPFTAPEIPEVNFEDGLDLDLVNEADQEIEPDQHIKDEL